VTQRYYVTAEEMKTMPNKLEIILTGLLWIMACAVVLGLAANKTYAGVPHLDCSQCHTCLEPTASNRCLKPCPSLSMVSVSGAHSLDESPEELVLDKITDLYQPVQFNHKLHAEMAVMGKGCVTCHHYSPSDDIPPCDECHGGEKNSANLRQPSLKGAYHRQCLSCHRDWSHETACNTCHLPSPGKAMDVDFDATDIVGIKHPPIHTPDKKIYNTPYQEGPVVTFHHNQHVDLYGLDCVDCHQQENCAYCHELKSESKIATRKTMLEVHSTCNNCHLQDKCSKCHDTREKPAFSHEVTGWPLNRFHKELGCRSCHPAGRPIAAMDSCCTSCHKNWSRKKFNHGVTGLKLNEIHAEFDCVDCHSKPDYSDPEAGCANCHDEDLNPKDTPPGQYITR
jgi:hypothetical protein